VNKVHTYLLQQYDEYVTETAAGQNKFG